MHCIPQLKQIYRLSKHNLEKTKVEQMKVKLVLYQTNWKQRRRKYPLITCNGFWFWCRETKTLAFMIILKWFSFFHATTGSEMKKWEKILWCFFLYEGHYNYFKNNNSCTVNWTSLSYFFCWNKNLLLKKILNKTKINFYPI